MLALNAHEFQTRSDGARAAAPVRGGSRVRDPLSRPLLSPELGMLDIASVCEAQISLAAMAACATGRSLSEHAARTQ